MMNHNKRNSLKSTANFTLVVASLVFSLGVFAETFPEKPITIIVPYAAGGATDFAARVYAEKLTQMWGKPVIVDNRPGASGNIGTSLLAHAKPDGYTIGLVASQHASAPALYKNLPYKLNDFKAVIVTSKIPMGLMARKDFPINSVKELIDYSKSNPGKLTAATAGVSSSQNLWLKSFQGATGLDILDVPFKSASLAYVELLSGRIDVFFDSPNPVMDQVRTGKLKMLAVGGLERNKLFPKVPTLVEDGYKVGADMISWNAILAPIKTPDDIVIKLNAAFSDILKDPTVVKKFEEIGTQIFGGTPIAAEKLIQSESLRQARIIKDNNINAE